MGPSVAGQLQLISDDAINEVTVNLSGLEFELLQVCIHYTNTFKLLTVHTPTKLSGAIIRSLIFQDKIDCSADINLGTCRVRM